LLHEWESLRNEKGLAGGITQVVACLSGKNEVLSSNTSSIRDKKGKEKKKKGYNLVG
jgi:hypothetical protein